MSSEFDSGTHTFEITGYSHKKGIGVGSFMRLPTFTLGGFDWSVRFYPDGVKEAAKDYVVALLELMSSNTEAQASYVLRFVNQAPQMLQAATFELPGSLCCYIVNDRLKIQCDLTVVRRSRLSEIEVPPCDMMPHFGNLLKEKKGVDVTFNVGGETIEAHRIVLAARSPVFKAEFFGRMRESGTSCVTVEDMQPEVFRTLLHFIYNDSLPDMGGLEGNDYRDMMWHLLAAADRYAMDRMKLVCQSAICRNLDVGTVATTLALADQHNCDRLKDACIEFIASPTNKDAVAATQGYANLKRTCPSVFIDLFE
ncbi:unnamed protein product [Urochloa decumbens]|uniref:Uncharacterized protein n=1 Tax=Urochloa decumbens TaxID=240449 RepID=A0ABC9BWA7_9POAL